MRSFYHKPSGVKIVEHPYMPADTFLIFHPTAPMLPALTGNSSAREDLAGRVTILDEVTAPSFSKGKTRS